MNDIIEDAMLAEATAPMTPTESAVIRMLKAGWTLEGACKQLKVKPHGGLGHHTAVAPGTGGEGMTQEAPKRIWVSDSILDEEHIKAVCCSLRARIISTNPIPYVRADIADETERERDALLQGAKAFLSLTDNLALPMSGVITKAELLTAIAKVEGTET